MMLAPSRPATIVAGMIGIGDNLHQRAVLRDLMKQGEVWLETPYAAMFHDLVEQGLRIVPVRRHISRGCGRDAGADRWRRCRAPRSVSR